MPRTMINRAGRRAALVLVAGSMACSEFPRTNPFDPAVEVALHINGPDTITTQFDTLQFSLQADPVFDFGPVEWHATGSLERLNDSGLFRFPLKEDYPFSREITVQARAGPRLVSKKVFVKLQVGEIRRCSTQGDTVRFSTLSEEQWVCTYYVDRHGITLDGFDPVVQVPQMSLKVLDETIVRSISGGFGAAKRNEPISSVSNGTTSLTVSGGGASLTLPVVVRQVPTYLSMDECVPNGLRLKVGQKVQLHVSPVVRDGKLLPIADPDVVQKALMNLTWTYYGSFLDKPIASVDQSGVVTGLLSAPPGFEPRATVGIYQLANGRVVPGSASGTCAIFVDP